MIDKMEFIKLALTNTFTATIFIMFGTNQAVLKMVLILGLLIIADIILGVAHSIKDKTFNRTTLACGVSKKICFLMIVAIAHLIDVSGLFNTNILIEPSAVIFYITYELMSIKQNAKILKIPLPNEFSQVIERGKIKND